ncbi:MAG: exonuclease domain-containing protein [bacterium]
MQVIYLDTETTGIEEEARLVQLAYKDQATGQVVNELFKPPVAISFGSMAVHHITSQMVESKPDFENSECRSNLMALLPDRILVAHNALFDINILKNEGVATNEYIDTLRVSRHLIDGEQYSLQCLRYFLNLNVQGSAHDALGDVLVLEKLFEYLIELIKKDFKLETYEQAVEKMLELTKMPVLLDVFVFGKYKGMTFREVSLNDQGYLEWLYNSETQKSELDQNEELVYTLKHYLKF